MKSFSPIPDWEMMAFLLRAMSHPIRLKILHELAKGAKCVRDVHELFEISQPNLSQHLNALKKAGLIGNHSNGPLRCYYLIRPDLVEKLLEELTKSHPTILKPKAVVVQEAQRNQKKKTLSF